MKGTEQIPLVDTDLPKGKTTAQHLKTFCSEGLLSKTQADEDYQTKGNYALKTEIPDVSNLATKDDVNAKVSGTGVSSMQVVTELPGTPTDGVLYIVVPADEATV